MKKIVSVLLLTLIFSCGVIKGEKNRNTETDTVYVPMIYVPDEMQQKIKDLEHENHLLRVEIDNLKPKLKELEYQNKVLRKVNEVENNLESIER